MRRWFQRSAVFLIIAGLIVGGLGWATAAALRMEEAQGTVQMQKERAEKLRRSLWRLDGLVSPQLARENGRPFSHYSALHAPVDAMTRQGICYAPGAVRLPSPLLDADLPPWVRLHFQYIAGNNANQHWQSPQVLPMRERDWLRQNPFHLTLANVTPEREEFLAEFRRKHPGEVLLAEIRKRSKLPTLSDAVIDNTKLDATNVATEGYRQQMDQSGGRGGEFQQVVPQANTQPNGPFSDTDRAIRKEVANSSRFAPRSGKEVDPSVNLDSITAPKSANGVVEDVALTPMTPLWIPSSEQPDYLLYARLARFGSREIAQGVVIDWPALREELSKLVVDLFPDGKLTPLPEGADEDAEGVMSGLPIQFVPGPLPDSRGAFWTPLRIGLAVAWAAVLLALLAAGLSGWSLIDLSERRIRFVSAVTHELRTPLTTLRLYLDMLTSGLVRDERQKIEYLDTLNKESERLHRLISNVLDFARLERQSARPAPREIAVQELVGQLDATWSDRCDSSGKELVIENGLPPGTTFTTDAVLVQQIVGNLIDNACKYSKCAMDRRVWLRALPAGNGRVAIEVEDRGPGIGRREWRSVFRPFRRGHDADVTAGGVGLGLALARRWAAMLGGQLELRRCGSGACFRLELPA